MLNHHLSYMYVCTRMRIIGAITYSIEDVKEEKWWIVVKFGEREFVVNNI